MKYYECKYLLTLRIKAIEKEELLKLREEIKVLLQKYDVFIANGGNINEI